MASAPVITEDISSTFNKIPIKLYRTVHISDTLQGSIWRAYTTQDGDRSVVIKLTKRVQHETSTAVSDGTIYHGVKENIVSEQRILKHLTLQSDCSPFITKFSSFLESDEYFIFIQEDGGHSLFEFVKTGHQWVKAGRIPVDNWKAVVKVIFKQLVASIAYIHSKRVSHHDISLENYLISDVPVIIDPFGKIQFDTNHIQIKLCDFGLAEKHTNDKCFSNKHCGKRQYKSPEVMNRKRNYNAKKNDVFGIGVCLFLLSFGIPPFESALDSDQRFMLMMSGRTANALKAWDLWTYVDPTIIDLFHSVFKYEEDRISVSELAKHPFIQ